MSVLRGAFILSAILAGIFIAMFLLVRSGWVSMTPTFTFGNLLLACSTICTGFIVAAFIQRSVQADRQEKELLLERLAVLHDEVGRLERFSSGGELGEIVAKFKQLLMNNSAINEVAEEIGLPNKVRRQLQFHDSIKELRDLMTETPTLQDLEILRAPAISAEVKEGVLRLGQSRKRLVDTKIQRLSIQIFKARFLVNRA